MMWIVQWTFVLVSWSLCRRWSVSDQTGPECWSLILTILLATVESAATPSCPVPSSFSVQQWSWRQQDVLTSPAFSRQLTRWDLWFVCLFADTNVTRSTVAKNTNWIESPTGRCWQPPLRTAGYNEIVHCNMCCNKCKKSIIKHRQPNLSTDDTSPRAGPD